MAVIPEVLAERVSNLEDRHEESQKILNGNLKRLWQSHEKLSGTIEKRDIENKEEHKEIMKETKKWPRGLAVAITLLSSLATGLLMMLVNQIASKFVP